MVALLEPLEAPVHPIEALRRVAFLLERTRAGTYRVEAFRNAVKTLKSVDAAEVQRARRGRHAPGDPRHREVDERGHRRGARR